MHPLVRDLYKRFLQVSKDHPSGQAKVLSKVKIAFEKNQHLKTEREVRLAVGRGRYVIREMITLIRLKRYRTMKIRYNMREEGD